MRNFQFKMNGEWSQMTKWTAFFGSGNFWFLNNECVGYYGNKLVSYILNEKKRLKKDSLCNNLIFFRLPLTLSIFQHENLSTFCVCLFVLLFSIVILHKCRWLKNMIMQSMCRPQIRFENRRQPLNNIPKKRFLKCMINR